jgi:hypothetical protein
LWIVFRQSARTLMRTIFYGFFFFPEWKLILLQAG